MAIQTQINVPVEFVDKRHGRGFTGAGPVVGTNYGNRNSLETYLTAQQPSTYTAARLRSMTHNDLVMAARRIQDNAGIR